MACSWSNGGVYHPILASNIASDMYEQLATRFSSICFSTQPCESYVVCEKKNHQFKLPVIFLSLSVVSRDKRMKRSYLQLRIILEIS